MTKHRGPNNPDTADALHYLALALADLPDTGETETVLKRVVDIRRATEGNSAFWTGVALNNLGVYYLQTERLQEARKTIFAGASILPKIRFPAVARRNRSPTMHDPIGHGRWSIEASGDSRRNVIQQ
ncbi:MAG: tetratricopeptide repeat protein [Opitutaceae bacterium]|nr:tetratricopeptide repeat protein [Opitutaceae bacterium]